MRTPHKHAEILRAIADGKDVQWSKNGGHTWGDYRNDGSGYDPLTHMDILWRIKPEPKPDVVAFYFASPFVTRSCWEHEEPNMRMVFDGETRTLKAIEVLK